MSYVGSRLYWHRLSTARRYLLSTHRYEMLTLKHAFQASTLKELIDKVMCTLRCSWQPMLAARRATVGTAARTLIRREPQHALSLGGNHSTACLDAHKITHVCDSLTEDNAGTVDCGTQVTHAIYEHLPDSVPAHLQRVRLQCSTRLDFARSYGSAASSALPLVAVSAPVEL